MFEKVQKVLKELEQEGFHILAVHGRVLSQSQWLHWLTYVLINDEGEVILVHRDDEKQTVVIERE